MTECTATATIQFDGALLTAICNLDPHPGPDHEDVVLGPWSEPPAVES